MSSPVRGKKGELEVMGGSLRPGMDPRSVEAATFIRSGSPGRVGGQNVGVGPRGGCQSDDGEEDKGAERVSHLR